MPRRLRRLAGLLLPAAILAGCSGLQLAPQASVPPEMALRRVAPEQAQRLYAVMTPLLGAMNEPLSPRQVRVGLIEDHAINAANAGGGNFYVTTGLLSKASTAQLRGVMAHEIAHEDLGHVAQMQILGAGLDVGARLLEDLIPAGSIITPIAGTLIARGYSRKEEYAADRHAVDILQRAGYSKETLVEALEWIARVAGGGGGFLSTHPATSERIAALEK
jgi:predicted Zn-dependent protease